MASIECRTGGSAQDSSRSNWIPQGDRRSPDFLRSLGGGRRRRLGGASDEQGGGERANEQRDAAD
jgi:hypothetical protein